MRSSAGRLHYIRADEDLFRKSSDIRNKRLYSFPLTTARTMKPYSPRGAAGVPKRGGPAAKNGVFDAGVRKTRTPAALEVEAPADEPPESEAEASRNIGVLLRFSLFLSRIYHTQPTISNNHIMTSQMMMKTLITSRPFFCEYIHRHCRKNNQKQ